MGISLNHVPEGGVAWNTPVDGNWTTLETLYVARQESDPTVNSVTGTTAETALTATATIPANTFTAGVVLPIWAVGSLTIPANTAGTFTFRLRWGGLTGTLLKTYTETYTANASARTVGWLTDHKFVGVTSGASGTADLEGFFVASLSNEGVVTANTSSLLTIDTTANKVFLWTVQLSAVALTAEQFSFVVDRG